jgi:hypothetical protein
MHASVDFKVMLAVAKVLVASPMQEQFQREGPWSSRFRVWCGSDDPMPIKKIFLRISKLLP